MIDQNVAEFEKMNINKWHSYGWKGKGSTIVVLDSSHKPYEHTNVIDPFKDNSDRFGHKGHVAQVVREVAPEATIIVFSWFRGMKQEIVNWIKEHEDEIDIINCSFNPSVGIEIFEQLKDVDIPIIMSSGNGERDSLPRIVKEDWVISVGAWEEFRDKRALYSNYGQNLDFVAYTNIFITTNSTTNNLMFNGTSCSAPVLSGLLGIYNGWLKSNGFTKLDREGTKLFLSTHSIDKLSEGYDVESGHGLTVLPDKIPEIQIIEEPEEEDSMADFKDMQGHWAEEYVDFVADKEIMNGFPDGTFQPNKVMTRAEVATVIARMLGFVPVKK